MSDETPAGAEDLDRLAAFFGDGVEWSMPDDEQWGGELFVGSEVVARLRAEVERLTDALSEANRRLESRNDTDAAYYYERDRAKAAERERDAAQYASREAWSRVEFLEANVLISGSDADREYRRRWPVDEDERP